jgi:hypothetical protein
VARTSSRMSNTHGHGDRRSSAAFQARQRRSSFKVLETIYTSEIPSSCSDGALRSMIRRPSVEKLAYRKSVRIREPAGEGEDEDEDEERSAADIWGRRGSRFQRGSSRAPRGSVTIQDIMSMPTAEEASKPAKTKKGRGFFSLGRDKDAHKMPSSISMPVLPKIGASRPSAVPQEAPRGSISVTTLQRQLRSQQLSKALEQSVSPITLRRSSGMGGRRASISALKHSLVENPQNITRASAMFRKFDKCAAFTAPGISHHHLAALTLTSISSVTPLDLMQLRTCHLRSLRDGNGVIDKNEFVSGIVATLPYCSNKDAEALFYDLDEDGSGSIDYQELDKTLRKWKLLDGLEKQENERALAEFESKLPPKPELPPEFRSRGREVVHLLRQFTTFSETGTAKCSQRAQFAFQNAVSFEDVLKVYYPHEESENILLIGKFARDLQAYQVAREEMESSVDDAAVLRKLFKKTDQATMKAFVGAAPQLDIGAAHLRKYFIEADADGKGYIEREQASEILRNLRKQGREGTLVLNPTGKRRSVIMYNSTGQRSDARRTSGIINMLEST